MNSHDSSAAGSVQAHFVTAATALRELQAHYNALTETITRRIEWSNYVFRQNYATSFQLRRNGFVWLDIIYFHNHRINGGKVDSDGDLIDKFLFHINYSEQCSDCSNYKSKKQKAMTAEEAVCIIRGLINGNAASAGELSEQRESGAGESVKKRAKSEVDDFCQDITEHLNALEKREDFNKKMLEINRLLSYML